MSERVMVFQIGSLGDTVIAMPCYREIARRHPGAVRYVLTNFPQSKMVQAAALLKPCGLVEESVEYPMPLRGAKNIWGLWRQIRALKIGTMYYLTPEKRTANMVRHWVFFKACGVGKIVGVPWREEARMVRREGVLWESEGRRLLRCLGVETMDQADRDMGLTVGERARAAEVLGGMGRFVVVCVGGKIPVKEWGDENWGRVLAEVSAARPGVGAVFVGSGEERERNEGLARRWAGPVVNACGLLTPRESAAVIERAEVFVGHDTGSLHMAAAVDTRVVGVYSARNEPGKWFSDRAGDTFFYERVKCFGCELNLVEECPHEVVCMRHDVGAVVASVSEVLGV